MKQTLYDILGVAPDTSFEDIELAYKKRFDTLKAETSWDSNRLVMLNEAREVLSDPARRSAYDASLAAQSQPGSRARPAPADKEPRSFAKWFIAGVMLAAILVWWSTRGDAPPGESVATSTPQAQSPDQAAGSAAPAAGANETSPDAAMLAPLAQQSETDAVAAPTTATDAAGAAPASVDDAIVEESEVEAPAPPSDAVPQAAAVSPIVASWSCFEPVTGRTSQYRFGNNGQFTIQQAGGGMQSGSYEVAGDQISVADVDLPPTMRIEELSERKLILFLTGESRRVVCSR